MGEDLAKKAVQDSLTYIRKKKQLIATITSDEEDIRFAIYAGEIPLWEAGKELVRRHQERTTGSLKDNWARADKQISSAWGMARHAWSEFEQANTRTKAWQTLKDIYERGNIEITRELISVQSELSELKRTAEARARLVRYLNKELKILRENTMYPNSTILEENKVDNSVIDFNKAKLIMSKAGTDSTIPPTDEDWLTPLPEDTYFTCGTKNPQDPNPVALEFIIIAKTPKTVLLQQNSMEDDKELPIQRFIIKKFCSLFELVEVIKYGERPTAE